MFLCELGRMVGVSIFIHIVVKVSGEGWRHGGLLESWRVGRRLSPELSEIEIRACPVAEIHGLVKLPFGPVSVEDHPIERDDNDFDHNFDDCADQGPMLEFQLGVSPSNIRTYNKCLPASCRSDHNLLGPCTILSVCHPCMTNPTCLARCQFCGFGSGRRPQSPIRQC